MPETDCSSQEIVLIGQSQHKGPERERSLRTSVHEAIMSISGRLPLSGYPAFRHKLSHFHDFRFSMRGPRAASSARTCRTRMLIASAYTNIGLFSECYCASRWHYRCHCRERRLRYVAVFWATLGQVATCLYTHVGVWSVNHNSGVEKLGVELFLASHIVARPDELHAVRCLAIELVNEGGACARCAPRRR